MVYSFAFQLPGYTNIIFLIPIISGLVVISLALLFRKKGENSKGIRHTFYGVIITGIAIVLIGIILMFLPSRAFITVGHGYVYVDTAAPLGGSINVTSNEITAVYLSNIDSGNLTLSLRKDGTSIGNLNLGLYTLSNGAMAYVASDNSTDVIIKLNNGDYVIMGTNQTSSLAAIITKEVYSVS